MINYRALDHSFQPQKIKIIKTERKGKKKEAALTVARSQVNCKELVKRCIFRVTVSSIAPRITGELTIKSTHQNLVFP
jgi:hypothetical protein